MLRQNWGVVCFLTPNLCACAQLRTLDVQKSVDLKVMATSATFAKASGHIMDYTSIDFSRQPFLQITNSTQQKTS